MIEHFAVFDRATGEYRYRAAGPDGTAAALADSLPEDMSLVVMPADAYRAIETDLGPLKIAVQALVDDAAGRFRCNFITTVPGQAETYLYKAEEARAWQADDATPTHFLAPEAAARNMTMADLATEVLANEAAWKRIGGRIEGLRVAAKAAIQGATTIGAIVAAAQVQWGDALAEPELTAA